MDAVTREFKAHLNVLRTQYAGRPRDELLALLLLALEREQMVTVAYRETLMTDRLRRTGLPPTVQGLVRHALIWVWKDEEMHAVYIRGLLLRMGGPLLRLRSILQQANGTIGGWASSVRLHVPWNRAPLLRSAATALQWLGVAAGKVPPEVRRELDYHPFRHFCVFNVDAERTASICWDRLISLARTLPDLPPGLVEEFGRMKQDEDNHCRVFEAIADALGPDDRLAPGWSEAALAERLRTVGDEFLSRAMRGTAREVNPLGTGGRVAIREGDAMEAVFRETLEAAGLSRVLSRLPAGFRVAIKPSFMMGYHRRDPSPHVDPKLVELLARILRDHGAGDVAVMEGPNILDHFFRNRDVASVARYLGFASPLYRIVDADDDQMAHRFGRGMASYSVSRTWRDAELRIALGKVKSHPVDHFMLSLAALEGIGPRHEQYIFAERQAHRSTALMTLLSDFPPHFAILDAWAHVPDGILGMMGSMHVKTPHRFYAGEDAVAVDFTAARHVGLPDPRAGSTVREACHWFGDPEGKIEVDGPDEPIRGWRGPYDNDMSALLSSFAYPFYTFFTGRGSLFVPEMDEAAFPPLKEEGMLVRLGRRWMQTLLIMRHLR